MFRLFAVGDDSEMISGKLEGIGFGFLVPIFFVVSEIRLNLEALFHQPSAFLRLPLFLILAEHRMVAANAAALVGAGMLSVLIYPLAAKVMLRRAESPHRDR